MEPDGPGGPAPLSPCVGVCLLDGKTGLCRGCLRTMAEIASWPALDAAAKRRVLALLPQRGALIDAAVPGDRRDCSPPRSEGLPAPRERLYRSE